FGLDAGTAAGLVAGSMTESATVGTAVDAIAKLGLPAQSVDRLTGGVTVAFAVTYLVGLVATVTFLSKVAPKLLGTDLAAACRALEDEMGIRRDGSGTVSAYYDVIMRAYAVPEALSGTTVAALERSFAPERVFVERARVAGEVLTPRPDLVLSTGDRVTLSARHHALAEMTGPLRAHEVEDAPLLDIPTLTLDVVVTNRELAGHPIQRFATDFATRGVFLRKLTRAGEELPYTLQTVVERGDVATMVGAAHHVEPLAQLVGWAAKPTSATNMVGVGLAIVVGGLVGLPALAIGSLELHLSSAVGVLLGGLVFGWMSSVSRRFGQIPEPALWLFDSLGLTAFIAAVGLSAGPDFVRGLREAGGVLVLAGLITAIVPHVVTLLVGRFVFRMHPGILLGVCCGAATSGPSLAAVQDVAKSRIPTLGYGVSYAVGNVLLAMWGGVIVALLGPG
ncbi:MAG: aspartate-alanine antiporter, partial [Burkholderiales bacterium]|nr:aspartate-alanine antiporter [Burkholderiales bacterium]